MIQILYIACLGALFSNFIGWVQLFKQYLLRKNINTWVNPLGYKQAKRLKPFDCEICLSFWIGICYFWGDQWTIPMAATSSVLALFIVKLAGKL